VLAEGGNRYATEDFTILDGSQMILQGDQIYCYKIEQGKCFIQDYSGDDEIPLSKLSKEKQPKIDFFLKDIKFTDSKDVKFDACQKGRPLSQLSDAFIWSYGFTVGNNRNNDSPVMVEVTHRISYQGRILNSPVIAKTWVGPADGKCHTIAITKKDIDGFIQKLSKITKIIPVEQDLNVDTQLEIELFAPYSEQTYKNNKIVIETRLPADNSATWPPSEF